MNQCEPGSDKAASAHGAARPDLNFELPVEPGFREEPPRGSFEEGWALSMAALEAVKDRPEVWAERDRMRCFVEFVWPEDLPSLVPGK